ncbi:MAG: DUF6544 family protein [Thermodesulfobacteriota bacterium]
MPKLVIALSSLATLLAVLLSVGSLRNSAARDEAFAAVGGLPALARPAALPPGLPAPLVKHLLATAPSGRPPARLARLEQMGHFRLAPDGDWLELDARQVLRGDRPALAWSARLAMNPVAWFWALDTYLEGRGGFSGRLYGLVLMAGGQGPEVDQSSLLRWLAEAPWLPGALAPRPGLTWSAGPEPGAAQVEISDGPLRASGVFHFDGQGLITRFFSQDRYRDQDGQPARQDWEVLYDNWRDLGGGLIPTQGEARWITPDGPFAYARVTVTAARYE